MSDKRYTIQLGNAASEEVSQKELDALKTAFGPTRFGAYNVSEVKTVAKPADLATPNTAGKTPRAADSAKAE